MCVVCVCSHNATSYVTDCVTDFITVTKPDELQGLTHTLTHFTRALSYHTIVKVMMEYSIVKGHSITKDYNMQYPTAGAQHPGTLNGYRKHTSIN